MQHAVAASKNQLKITAEVELLEFIYRLFYGLYEEIRFRLYYGPVFHRFLNRKYHYYHQLPAKSKLRFLRLVRDHFEYFKFEPRGGMRLTRGRKAIISAAASQLAMHLPSESLTFYTRIFVYPDHYKSVHTGRLHKGEVNPGFRLIVFSWRAVEEGLNPGDDGLNLLLHEFAHALWLEHKLMHHEYTVLDAELVARFERLAALEMEKMTANQEHFFRRYAFSNIEEFFAVAVENFFERPSRFKREVPEIYDTLMRLLCQNPLDPASGRKR
jgi:Mlc titration factor MtfA (ptsG expression regulator)